MSTARGEQNSFSNSVYGKFVIPHSIEVNDLRKQTHSIALLGSRGCGKTTYIRYFSHWTQFDQQRKDFNDDDFHSVILYWKPDTVFYRSIAKGWASPKESEHFFAVLSGLELFKELIFSLKNMAFHFNDIFVDLNNSQQFSLAIETITGSRNCCFEDLITWAESALYSTRNAIRHLDCSKLENIDPNALIQFLVPIIQDQCNRLKSTRFKLYVDEFENLDISQQRTINGYRKGSNARFTWNVAYKRFAEVTSATDGNERLGSPDDYREIIMEVVYGSMQPPNAPPGSYKTTEDSRLLTSEIFLLGLLNENVATSNIVLTPENLCNPKKISLRNNNAYKSQIFALMEKLFPTKNASSLATEAMKQNAVINIVESELKNVDGLSSTLLRKFISEQPGDALVSSLIVNQKTFKSSQLINFINNKEPERKAFIERIQTYRMSAILSLNARYDYINIPIYSGFERFNHLSLNNIRHFIELCYQTLRQLEPHIEIKYLEDIPSVSTDDMHRGVVNASGLFIQRVNTFEPMGKTLSRMANRLGSLFQTLQRQKVQSEPEKVSFIIKGEHGDLNENLNKIIEAAKGWTLLLEGNITRDRKAKKVVSANKQYRLNPVYSPNFGTSYLTGRTVELTQSEFELICDAQDETFSKWLLQFSEGKSNTSKTKGLFD
ncbi:MAG: hypothetical protein PSN44_03655 [Gammaproteobacteria bacterium]|nr:hypothetical protein [Gammaproteobacteria bacterium]